MRFISNQFNSLERPMRGDALLMGLFLLGACIGAATPGRAMETFDTDAVTSSSYLAHHGAEGSSPPEGRRQWRSQRKSPELAFNPVRQSLLHDLLLGQCKEQDLIDESTRHALHRQGALPPGIQRQLLEGKPLPAGLSKKMVLLPVSVNNYLGLRAPAEVRVGVLGDDILLYNTSTGVVLDILRGLL